MSEEHPDYYKFPRRINDPTMVYVFPFAQIVPTVIVIMIMAYIGQTVAGVIVGLVIFFVVGKILEKGHIDEPIHSLWQRGLLDILVAFQGSRTVVNPVIKRFFN